MARERFNLAQYSSGIIVPLLVVAIALLAYFAILPKYKEVRQKAADLKAAEQSLKTRQGQFASVKNLIEDLKVKEPKLAVVAEALPTAPGIAELLANFDYLVKQSGLLITGLQFTPVATLETLSAGASAGQAKKTEELSRLTENLAILQADLTARGRYVNLKTFLANLEQNLRLMDVLALTFGPVDAESGLQDYTLKIQTYYQKE